MNEEQLNKYKQMLLDEKETLEKELSEIGIKNDAGEWEAVPEQLETESDQNDLADKFEDYEERSALLGAHMKRYKDVVHALDKINNNPGAYGVCEISHNPISKERLLANPAARTNIENMEKGE